jgi:hypothetical protein
MAQIAIAWSSFPGPRSLVGQQAPLDGANNEWTPQHATRFRKYRTPVGLHDARDEFLDPNVEQHIDCGASGRPL